MFKENNFNFKSEHFKVTMSNFTIPGWWQCTLAVILEVFPFWGNRCEAVLLDSDFSVNCSCSLLYVFNQTKMKCSCQYLFLMWLASPRSSHCVRTSPHHRFVKRWHFLKHVFRHVLPCKARCIKTDLSFAAGAWLSCGSSHWYVLSHTQHVACCVHALLWSSDRARPGTMQGTIQRKYCCKTENTAIYKCILNHGWHTISFNIIVKSVTSILEACS